MANKIKLMTKLLADGLHDLDGLPYHFGADAVAFDQRNFIIHLPIPRSFREFSRPPLVMIPLMNSGKGAA